MLDQHPRFLEGCAGHLAVTGGEEAKSFASLEQVLRSMVRLDLDRNARLVALGGGTLGDLGGLAAALYKRGVELIAVPTTLLAMLDSSVGGKTGINVPEGKNLIGHVWPASSVLIDPGFLSTLSDTEYRSGLGEAVKMAIGLDAELFELLESEPRRVMAREPEVLEQVILLAVAAKIRVVEEDVHESGPRRLLNLGHTLGHALEMHSSAQVPHGHAVARGLWFALEVGQAHGAIDEAAADRCRALLRLYDFEETPLPAAAEVLPFLSRDKKIEGGSLHFVVPRGIGTSGTMPLALTELSAHL